MTDGFTYRWPRPALTVDVALFGLQAGQLSVLLIRRRLPPFEGWWALPGGFVRLDEGLEWAARRELEEEAGVRPAWIEQIGAFGAPGRDPRERVVSVAWWALLRADEHAPVAASDASEVRWHPVASLPALAFDHATMVTAALHRLRQRAWESAIGAELLGEQFTLGELQTVQESLLGHPLDKRNFRRRMNESGLLVEAGEARSEGPGRPARLFRLGDRMRGAPLGSTRENE
ncbi:MAG: NUDIX domain-containing protein [Myxococcales bacterium]|nr:NUDIX domain-containing protein [Myxococcales bacterium]